MMLDNVWPALRKLLGQVPRVPFTASRHGGARNPRHPETRPRWCIQQSLYCQSCGLGHDAVDQRLNRRDVVDQAPGAFFFTSNGPIANILAA